jgi:hypothetical protein
LVGLSCLRLRPSTSILALTFALICFACLISAQRVGRQVDPDQTNCAVDIGPTTLLLLPWLNPLSFHVAANRTGTLVAIEERPAASSASAAEKAAAASPQALVHIVDASESECCLAWSASLSFLLPSSARVGVGVDPAEATAAAPSSVPVHAAR